MSQVNCDHCKQDFEINTNTRKVDRDIELVFFTCPHCNQEYQSYFTNAKIRTRQTDIKKLYLKLRTVKTKEQLDSLYERIEDLKNKNLIGMQQLKNRF